KAARGRRKGPAAVGRLVNAGAGARVTANAEVEDVRVARIGEEVGDLQRLRQPGGELPRGAAVVAAEDAVGTGGHDDVRIGAADDDRGRRVDRAADVAPRRAGVTGAEETVGCGGVDDAAVGRRNGKCGDLTADR